MDHSPEIGALAEALAKAQAAIQNPTKNREVEVKLRDNAGKYKFKYATFDGIIDALRPHLTANGIWFIQAIVSGNMVTRITHSSGQWLDSVVPMPNLTGKPQEIGSLITYFKRYGLSAAFGVAVDEDDDANAAEGNSVEFKSSAPKAAITPSQQKALRDLCVEVGADEAAFLAKGNVTSFSDILVSDFAAAKTMLEKRRKPKADTILNDEIPY